MRYNPAYFSGRIKPQEDYPNLLITLIEGVDSDLEYAQRTGRKRRTNFDSLFDEIDKLRPHCPPEDINFAYQKVNTLIAYTETLPKAQWGPVLTY